MLSEAIDISQIHNNTPYVLDIEQHQIVQAKFFNSLLKRASDLGVSDIYIEVKRQIKCRLHGVLEYFTHFDLTRGYVNQLAELIYGASGVSSRLVGKDLDCSYQFKAQDKLYRYRVSMAKDIQGVFIQLRPLEPIPPKLSEIGMEGVLVESMTSICDGGNNHGMGKVFVIAGETGSGKTTSIAALIRYLIEESRLKNDGLVIYTAEAPVEYSYDEIDAERSVMRQFEIGKCYESFYDAVRGFMRKSPDVINIGETRDYETLEAILQASNTGHAAITTIHANSVAQIVTRMIDLIPSALRESGEIKRVLESIGVAVFQKLVKRKVRDESSNKGGRVALREYLIFTPEVQAYLIQHIDNNFTQAVQYCVERYGRSYEQHRAELIKQGVIDG
ncbi:type IV pilus twitching motility protein PilT [Fangia hongkongensis]|uniref:type IV pilus twitching motility protein PilT n=1 Tax=Fangia hongkongensis TaxID=270495 RepID=UPI00036B0059|nr:ATPase, T2SS/T4P/T4SS family [Fangia hongkongensis]MBK2125658.1 Flp pilus assembly complex ATPase component TadA [Fangia hongkongensis]